jgi:hypothetical protein
MKDPERTTAETHPGELPGLEEYAPTAINYSLRLRS